mmetsp:Transcript_30624/g.93702  ORF Transcript_30624/g.93702 Transcript_30624/m.93702 type:complete len:84 (+) Transcript_30624:383-634(+)
MTQIAHWRCAIRSACCAQPKGRLASTLGALHALRPKPRISTFSMLNEVATNVASILHAIVRPRPFLEKKFDGISERTVGHELL